MTWSFVTGFDYGSKYRDGTQGTLANTGSAVDYLHSGLFEQAQCGAAGSLS